jgi:hypothetical protein
MPVEVTSLKNLRLDTEKTNITKKKTCNKKFCYDCLQKNFPSFWDSRSSKDWRCPCCLNECPCSQCKKIWVKLKNWKEQSEFEEEKIVKKKSVISDHIELEDDEDLISGSSKGEKDENNFYKEDSFKESGAKLFDINSIHSILHNSKISTDKLGPIARPKVKIFYFIKRYPII